MRLMFTTNLDEAKRDVDELNYRAPDFPAVPRVGENIEFMFDREERKRFDLRVVAVTYSAETGQPRVELHLPPHFKSITEWTTWFKRHRWGREW